MCQTVPVVVVFTQFDLLINRMEQDLTNEEIDLPESVIDALCLERADAQFQEVCVGPLKRIEPTLAHVRSFGLIFSLKAASRWLIALVFPTYIGLATAVISNKAQAAVKTLVHRTQNLFQRDVEEKLWIVAAMAQRASAQIKISASIE
jgi:hypothetical protein